jgi:choline dehydrogenase
MSTGSGNAKAVYDVIIVGAGTAGCVMAEQLTRSGRLRVLLLEAGGQPTNPFVSVPAGFPQLFKSDVDWAFSSEPQAAIGGRVIYTPRGKMLGGCSNINAMVHQWCHPVDFDGWVESGAIGWSWQDVAPVFRGQECWLGNDGDPGRGRDGPMVVSPNQNVAPLSRKFVEAARRAGLGNEERYNGLAYQGAWHCELAIKDGRRYSAYNAYLEPAMRRSNLEVITQAHAARVLHERGRATGVAALRGGTEQTFVGREVVLAAGAFGSPQLLMLSGIGPAAALQDLGLPVRVDRPGVGQHLQDHPVLAVVFRTGTTETFLNAGSQLNEELYRESGRGMLASNGVEGFAFTQVRPGSAPAPDLELLFLPLEWRNQGLEPPQQHAFTISAAVLAPCSRGQVTLRSPDPLDPPIIDFRLLSDRDGVDATILWEGIRLSRRIAATAPLAEDNAGEMRPGAAAESDRDLADFANRELQTVYHPTSTCRMGPDRHSVVDPQLRVHGVDGLWVADASVMPTVPRGHPNAVVAMIAQRASGWIEQAARR